MNNLIEIDFNAARLDREKLMIAVAGLIDANPRCADAAGVAEFAFETRHHNQAAPDRFYFDALDHLRVTHSEALAWAVERLGSIDGWRGAIYRMKISESDAAQ
jgi:hypothetical protein